MAFENPENIRNTAQLNQNVVSSRMTYGRFLEYLEMGWVKQVDLYDNSRNAIIQASSPELGNRPQTIRVEIPVGASQLIQKLKEYNIDFDAHPAERKNLFVSIASNILLPIILCLPFYFSIYNLTFLNSFFESVSGFTSTGFTVFENIKHIDQSLILWRSSIQWIGGLYFLFSIIFLIDIYDENFKKTLTNYLSFNSSEILKQSFKIFLLYSIITVFIFTILNLLSIRSFNSLNLAFTIISSGGFLPTNELSNILVNNTQNSSRDF